MLAAKAPLALLNHLLTGRAEDGVIAIDRVRSKKAYIKDYAPKL